MKVPLSWLKEFVDIDLSVSELAHRLTLAGLEVEEVRFVGLPMPEESIPGHTSPGRSIEANVTGLAWDREKIVVGEIREVMPHPNADRLVLCRLFDGDQEHTVLTGAPNLFPYLGQGPLDPPLKVAYAREGARIYDGHQPGAQIFTLKRAKIRGVESYSMACSEKELGISEEHEGVILLDADAPTGMPLADYMGDVVLDITLTPNMARDANILGVAREVAALTGARLREPSFDVPWQGLPIGGRVALEIGDPELNPRFVLGLLEGVRVGPSPYRIQLRLRMAGMRPINNIVDATNYAMLEIGEPLHAFDYDLLVARAGGQAPRIITRLPEPGERLVTLDGVERQLDEFTILVADQTGPLSLAGVMGGAETEVTEKTRRVLLEGATWNPVHIRRTATSQNLISEASWRFERGVHPAMAERGVRRGLALMQQLAGGEIAEGLVDAYPKPYEPARVRLDARDIRRWLGIELKPVEVAGLLAPLGFEVDINGEQIEAVTPDHRLDIGEGIVGKADLMEEIARIYGYDRIPETRIADELPPPHPEHALEAEEAVRDQLAGLGLQEVVTYRLTTPEKEARLWPESEGAKAGPYVWLENPISADRTVMRRSLLASLLEVAEQNAKLRDRLAIFEIGPVFLPEAGEALPEEPLYLGLVLTGPRNLEGWQVSDRGWMDFYDLKGILESLAEGLHLIPLRFEPHQDARFHPGKCARVLLGEAPLGMMGELHPRVKANYDLRESPLIAAELAVAPLLVARLSAVEVRTIKAFPPVYEDLAVVVDEGVSAEEVVRVIREAGGALLEEVRLFDLYRGDQIGPGKKSLAYALVYQAEDRTLTDEEVAEIRARIVQQLESALNARLRT